MKKLLKIGFIWLLLQNGSAYAMNINNLYSPSASNDTGVQITNSSGASSVIQYTEINFYTIGCGAALGSYAVTGGQRNFNNGQTVSINSSSMYKIANLAGVTIGSIGCAKISICSNSGGSGNCNSRGINCPSFTLGCSGSNCTSGDTATVTTYGTGGGSTCNL